MKRSQLYALAAKKQFKLDTETENFILFIEKSMRNSIAKQLYEYEETLCQLGVGGDDVAYYCANIVKEGGEDYE